MAWLELGHRGNRFSASAADRHGLGPGSPGVLKGPSFIEQFARAMQIDFDGADRPVQPFGDLLQRERLEIMEDENRLIGEGQQSDFSFNRFQLQFFIRERLYRKFFRTARSKPAKISNLRLSWRFILISRESN